MFDNRWENWSGDFAESLGAGHFDASTRYYLPDILATFGNAVRKHDADFPDEVRPGTLATVLVDVMPRLAVPDGVREQIPEVVASFLDYLRETGKVGDAGDWAAQVRIIGQSFGQKLKPGGGVKGTTVRKPADASPLGRNDPCPCGSGRKYKKCCLGSA